MSARRRANPGRVEDVGRAPSPAALQLRLILFPQGHAVAGEWQNLKSKSKASGEGARPTPAVNAFFAPLVRQL